MHGCGHRGHPFARCVARTETAAGKDPCRKIFLAGNFPKVVERNVTARIEGVVSSVKGVESVSSVSKFGGGSVEIQLKPNVNVSAVKFEIMSAIRQIQKKFPEEVSYPVISGERSMRATNMRIRRSSFC